MSSARFLRVLAPLVLLLLAAPAMAETAQEILRATDKVRNPGQPFRLINKLVEYHDGKPGASVTLRVYAKIDPATGQYRNLVRYLEPSRDVGKSLLMSGSIMWFYDPASSASVRISPQQRLLGQASNGDVLAVNLSGDYHAELVAEETIDDADRQQRQCWHLDLTAGTAAAVYGRIEYWVEKGTYYPVKGRFFSDSGRLFKVVYYRKYQHLLGGVRPTEAVILDELDNSTVTMMRFGGYESIDIPEAWFQRDYLSRLPPE
jgi:hypothetical protein